MEELKEMADLIISNGYKINILDFKCTSGQGNVFISGKTQSLEHSLKDIYIYKEHSTDITLTYLRNKVKDLKELLAIKDGSIFNQEIIELQKYIELK
jgi:hypothetical protein